jgi:hypothetical protein
VIRPTNDGKIYAMSEPVDIDAGSDEITAPTLRVTMAELLARFDPTNHRHDLAFDIEALRHADGPHARPIAMVRL